MVASATRRARHAGTAPASTRRYNLGEAVPQLQRLSDQVLCRDRGHAEHGAELRDAELRHQRAPLAGDLLLVLGPWNLERSGGVDRLRRVRIGPGTRQLEQLRLRRIGDPATIPGGGQQLGVRRRVGDPAPPDPLLDHVFDRRRSHRHPSSLFNRRHIGPWTPRTPPRRSSPRA